MKLGLVIVTALAAFAAGAKEAAVVVCGHPDDLISCAGAALVGEKTIVVADLAGDVRAYSI